MKREDALPYIGYAVDNALNECQVQDMPENAHLVGWQCGFVPVFVAVWSYLGGSLDDDEAADLAQDLLREKGWFDGPHTDPDYIL